jgi:hypothetical protein
VASLVQYLIEEGITSQATSSSPHVEPQGCVCIYIYMGLLQSEDPSHKFYGLARLARGFLGPFLFLFFIFIIQHWID